MDLTVEEGASNEGVSLELAWGIPRSLYATVDCRKVCELTGSSPPVTGAGTPRWPAGFPPAWHALCPDAWSLYWNNFSELLPKVASKTQNPLDNGAYLEIRKVDTLLLLGICNIPLWWSNVVGQVKASRSQVRSTFCYNSLSHWSLGLSGLWRVNRCSDASPCGVTVAL